MPDDQLLYNLLHLDASRTLHQQQITGHNKARQKFGGFPRRCEKLSARAWESRSHRAFHNLSGITGHADDPINLPGLRGQLPGLAMQFRSSRAEFSHLACAEDMTAAVLPNPN